VLKGCSSAESRYLFARCCVDLGKLQEAELALTGALSAEPTEAIAFVDRGSGMAYALLGKVGEREKINKKKMC
jgi:hypothetical protein